MAVSERLDGRVVIVTGASRGIGKGLAVGLASLGASVVCAARSAGESVDGLPGTIEETVAAVTAAGGRGLAVRCDIGVAEDIDALVGATLDAFGRVDVLVNNAMTPTHATFAASTVDDFDRSMRVNVRSLYLLTKAVAPAMTRQGGGSIINMSSGGAAHETTPFMPPGYLIYSVAKAALERFSTALAPELVDAGITVHALRPGAVRTEQTELEFGEDHDWTGWTMPEAVVPAVAFLANQIGTAFTGRVLESTQYPDLWP